MKIHPFRAYPLVRDFFHRRPILLMLLWLLCFAVLEAALLLKTAEAIASGEFHRSGHVITLAGDPARYRLELIKHLMGIAAFLAILVAMLWIGWRMIRAGEWTFKPVRPPRLPRHRVAPLIDPTKRSNR